jgi:M6 family metalloprotease-like protein
MTRLKFQKILNKRLIAFLSILSLSLSLPLIPVKAAVKAGSSCKTIGITSVASGKTFTCTKTGKKLVWLEISNKLGSKKLTSPKSFLSIPSLFSDLEKCKIVDGDPELTNMTAGFPIPAGRVDLVKGAKILIVGVDFPDKVGGDKNPKDLNEYYTSSIEKFWSAQSTKPVKFDWKWMPEWVRMPNNIKSYGLGGNFFTGKWDDNSYFQFTREVIAEIDSKVNFEGVNFLFIVLPPTIKNDEVGVFIVHTQGVYETREGKILNLIIAGSDQASYRDTWIHEFGHGLGLTDIRDTQDVGAQKSDGMYFDIMNNPNIPELLVWHRFLLGFLEDSQVHCVTDSKSSTHWISPVEKKTNLLKGVVIPISSTEAVIIESRRPAGMTNSGEYYGAVVYSLDSKIPYRRSPVKVINILKNGNSVRTRGYEITVIESGDFGDVVKVEKV